jgi:hypothetical protein
MPSLQHNVTPSEVRSVENVKLPAVRDVREGLQAGGEGVKPKRVQLSRRKGYRKPEGAISVARPSRWGNPYRLTDYQFANADGTPAPHDAVAAREMAVRDFEAWLHCTSSGEAVLAAAKRDLRGKDLACWCALPKPGEPDVCHAVVLLEIANS